MIMLPADCGFAILEPLHENEKSEWVLVLTARDSLYDKLKGLGLGADDYLTKPFYYSELNARIKAIVRRKQFKTSKEVRFSNIQINLDQRLVAVSGNQVNLTKKEYAILTHLISNRKRILSKVALAE